MTTETTSKLLSQRITAVEGGDIAGAIVYWRLSSGTDGAALAEALERRGIDPETGPELPSPSSALTRCMNKVCRERGLFPKRRAGAIWGIATFDGDGEEKRPEFEADWGVALDEVGRLTWRNNPSEEIRGHVRAVYKEVFSELSTGDISSWLLREMDDVHALTLRDTGGVYMIDREGLDQFSLRVEALHEVSGCRVHLIPAMHSDTAVDAFLDGLISEVEAFVSKTASELEDEEMGTRAIANRRGKIDRMLSKVEKFEGLLGTSLDNLRGQLVKLEGVAVAASLAAEADEDEG